MKFVEKLFETRPGIFVADRVDFGAVARRKNRRFVHARRALKKLQRLRQPFGAEREFFAHFDGRGFVAESKQKKLHNSRWLDAKLVLDAGQRQILTNQRINHCSASGVVYLRAITSAHRFPKLRARIRRVRFAPSNFAAMRRGAQRRFPAKTSYSGPMVSRFSPAGDAQKRGQPPASRCQCKFRRVAQLPPSENHWFRLIRNVAPNAGFARFVGDLVD